MFLLFFFCSRISLHMSHLGSVSKFAMRTRTTCKSVQVRTSCSCSCKSLQVFSFGKYPAPRALSPPSTNWTNAQLSLSLLRLQPRLAAQKCNYIASKSLEQPSLCIPQVAAWQPLSQLLRGMSQQSCEWRVSTAQQL